MREPIPRLDRAAVTRADQEDRIWLPVSPRVMRDPIPRVETPFDSAQPMPLEARELDLVVANLLCFREAWPDATAQRGHPPSLLTRALAIKFCMKVIKGSTRAAAAASLGLHRPGTISEWLARNAEPYITFHRWVVNADGFYRELLERKLNQNVLVSPDVSDQLRVLERRYRADWGAPKEMGPLAVVSLSVILQRIEESKAAFRDPRMIVESEGEIVAPSSAPSEDGR
jgi:hypothetical protein